MSFASGLLAAHRAIGRLNGHLDAAVCQYRLSSRAHRAELQGGFVLNPKLSHVTSYLPYYAAKPVAPHIAGARRAGFAAAAQWGASCAVSALRTDLPIVAFYYLAFLREPAAAVAAPDRARPARPALAGRASPADETEADPSVAARARARAVRNALPYLPLLLGAWECFIGTGSKAEVAERADGRAGALFAAPLPPFEQLRRVGLLGLAETKLLALAALAAQRGQQRREIAVLAIALGVRLLLAPVRFATASAVGAAAMAGAVVGVAAEACLGVAFAARALLYQRLGAPAVVVRMQDALGGQAGMVAPGLGLVDDTVLSAPLAAALWQFQLQLDVPANNVWTLGGIAAAEAYLQVNRAALAFAPNLRRQREPRDLLQLALHAALFGGAVRLAADQRGAPWGPQERPAGFAPPGPAQQAADGQPVAAQYAGGIDVHERGRDPATRVSLARLLQLYPQVPQEACLRELRAVLRHHEEHNTAFAHRRHEHLQTGSLLTAARKALGERGHQAPGFAAVLSGNQHNMRLDDGRTVSVQRVCATTWYAISQLTDPRGEPFSGNLRAERRDAFVAALADIIDRFGHRVCAAGQCQRMLLVLQGSVAGVQIENYEEPPTTPQFVTYVYQQIVNDLGDEPSQEQVRRRYSEAYRMGQRQLPAPLHARLQQELATLALVDHDVDWQPQ